MPVTDNNPQPQPAGKCLNIHCARPSRCRGLCRSCCTAAAALVRAERTTWEELEQHGKTIPIVHTRGNTAWLLDFTNDGKAKCNQCDARVGLHLLSEHKKVVHPL